MKIVPKFYVAHACLQGVMLAEGGTGSINLYDATFQCFQSSFFLDLALGYVLLMPDRAQVSMPPSSILLEKTHAETSQQACSPRALPSHSFLFLRQCAHAVLAIV